MHATSITAACRRARRGRSAAASTSTRTFALLVHAAAALTPPSTPPVNRRTTLKGVTAACAVAAAPSPADAIEKASKSRAAQLTGVLYDCRRGLASPATPDDALASMLNANVLGAGAPLTRGVLCVSERHDCFDHHLAQLYTIKQLRKALRQREDRAQVAVGLEAFQRIHQTYLDRYVSADPNYGANPRGNQNVAIDATGRVGSMAWSFQAIAATLSP